MSPTKSNLTRVLHLALLAIVLHQVIGSAFVERPLPGDDPEWPFLLHVWSGVAGLQVLLAFWVWTLVRDRHETPFSTLVPWVFPRRMIAIFAEVGDLVRDLMARRVPSFDFPAIAGVVHGLGLLLATLLAVSGSLWYFVLNGTFAGRVVLLIHELAGNLMWAYLVGHVSMALLHHFVGEDRLMKMFWLRRGVSQNPVTATAK